MKNFAAIEQAVAILRRGGLVAMPTETVYGLAADARQEEAVRRIFAAKQRPLHHPLIVHIASVNELSEWVETIPACVPSLAEKFWPGPLTLIFKKNPRVSDLVTGGQDTIGLRIPKHPVAEALLQAFGSGLAAPSANQFTHVSPTDAAAVREELSDKVDLILDGGNCSVGLESTILDVTQETPVILRPGMITQSMLSAVLHKPVLCTGSSVRAAGMHPVHYAPQTKTILVDTNHLYTLISSEIISTGSAALITHTPLSFDLPANIYSVRLSSSPAEYAYHIYRVLRELDNGHFHQIVIESVPPHAAWDAIRDRLNKACAVAQI